MSHKLNDKSKKRTLDVTESTDLRSFQDLHLGPDLTKGLNEAGFLRPSPVQWSALPMASLGVDMVVQAKSGTGKTLVFVVSALRMVKLENDCVQVILIAPTREIGKFCFSVKIEEISRIFLPLRFYVKSILVILHNVEIAEILSHTFFAKIS